MLVALTISVTLNIALAVFWHAERWSRNFWRKSWEDLLNERRADVQRDADRRLAALAEREHERQRRVWN